MTGKKNNIIKYRKPFHLNIGIIVFAFIIIYLCFYVFSYLTQRKIGIYEVEQGTIAENNTYQALALREESVFYSEYSGVLDYYISDTAKIGSGDLICSVDEEGEIARRMAAANSDDLDLNSSYFKNLKNSVKQYTQTYSGDSFYRVYDFKEQVGSLITEAVNQSTLSSVSLYVDQSAGGAGLHRSYAVQPGIVNYSIDGYENVSTENFTPELIRPLDYSKETIKNNSSISSGDAMYKLITSENWALIFRISEDVMQRLNEDSYVRLRFVKDGTSCLCRYEIRQIGDSYYMFLSLNNHMIRFAGDRYLDIELLLDEQSGLKIPNTAIVTKDFFEVPKEYFVKGGDSNAWGVYVIDGETHEITFREAAIYDKSEEAYYISSSVFSAGEILQKPDSAETFMLSRTKQLRGVYNVNKGYAVFKRIEIVYQNEEYTIIKNGTGYGLSLYDHIALEGDAIEENELINYTR